MKRCGSQGEHKLSLFTLKNAEVLYLTEKTRQIPIMLFDDLLGFIDNEKSGRIIEFLKQRGQFFITTVDVNRVKNILNEMNYPENDVQFYHMENDGVLEQSEP